MNDHDFNKGIGEIKKIGMTAAEKRAILSRVVGEPAPVRSPWTVYSFSAWVSNNRTVATLTTTLVAVVIIVSGGVVRASHSAVPGDFLYPLKVDVTEPLRAALTFSPQAKAELATSLTVERLSEAERLATAGELDAPKQAELSGLIAQQTTNLDTTLKQVAQKDPAEATALSARFNTKMREHAQRLDDLAKADEGTSIQAAAPVIPMPPAPVKTAPVRTFKTTAVKVPSAGAPSAASTASEAPATTISPEVNAVTVSEASSTADSSAIASSTPAPQPKPAAHFKRGRNTSITSVLQMAAQARKSGDEIGSRDWRATQAASSISEASSTDSQASPEASSTPVQNGADGKDGERGNILNRRNQGNNGDQNASAGQFWRSRRNSEQ